MIMSYLKTAPSNLSSCKFNERIKIPRFWIKNALLCYCWARTLKTASLFEVGTLEFTKNEFLTYTVNFGIESAFSKGPVSAFSQCLDPGTGLFYKVFQSLKEYSGQYSVLI